MSVIAPREKLFSHLGKLAALQAGMVPPPANVEIDLSNRCSLGCSWCHFSFTHTRGPLAGKHPKPEGAVPGGDLMDTSLALRIVEQLAALGSSVTWTGGGEPTLHPDFNAIVEHGERRGLVQGIYSHGGHIDGARAELLKRAMTFVYVSLDAVSRKAYLKSKGVDRFDQACAGIKLLADAPGDAKVGVGMLVGAHTDLEDIPNAAWLADRLGADYVQFRPVVSFDVADAGVPTDDRSWVAPAVEAIGKAAYYCPNVEWDPSRFRMYAEWAGHGYSTCWWSALQTVITPNGKVFTCVNKREHADAELGDLTVSTFEEIWASRPVATVDGSCRVACRGHIPNRALDEIMRPVEHAAFI